MTNSLNILKRLQTKSGLFVAAPSDNTGYTKVWIRDNVYAALGLEAAKDIEAVKKIFHALLNVLLKHEYKIDWAIKEKPDAKYKYIHARYHPETFEEFYEEWGNKQNDMIGALLFNIGKFEKKGIKILRNHDDIRIIQKLVYYLANVEYWHDKDNGMWEENEEVHASSIGACIAGLKAVQGIVEVPEWLIEKGIEALNKLLPRESETKEADLALLSLIYPYNVVSEEQKRIILKNVEEKLVKEKGVIRYIGDQYYNNGAEAEWTFGFPWLAKIYKDMGNYEKYYYYIKKTKELMTEKGELPELYYANTNEYNENTPLAWSQAMQLVAVT